MKKPDESSIRQQYREITLELIQAGRTISTMESCTAGLIASLLTDTEGSSAILREAFVTYSNEAKIRRGVPAEAISRYGVYSEETALAMARACRESCGADIGLGITGTMGNVDPENGDSVPGTVFAAVVGEETEISETFSIPAQETRFAYKMAAAGEAAAMLRKSGLIQA